MVTLKGFLVVFLAMLILDGKAVAKSRYGKLKQNIDEFKQKSGITPGLAVVLVGEDPASQVYVRMKNKKSESLGYKSFAQYLSANASRNEIIATVEQLNADQNVHGILVQLPLPDGIDKNAVIQSIDPAKDVDCLTFHNQGRLWAGQAIVTPCTPAGVMAILEHYDINPQGMRTVVLGRSEIVGRPMAHLLVQANATVTICHSRTKDHRLYTKEADLVVVATGKMHMFGREDFRKDSIVIDVGVHRRSTGGDQKYILCGDVHYEQLQDYAKAVTPVPGGVGPMTICMLMENTLALAKRANP